MKNCYLTKLFPIISICTGINYRHAKKVLIMSINNNDYNDFYDQSDTFLLADVYEIFRNKCTEVYELDSGQFHRHLD